MNDNAAQGPWLVSKGCQPWLGTYVDIQVAGGYSLAELQACQQQLFAEIALCHRELGFHQADGELGRLNRAGVGQFAISERLYPVLALAKSLYEHSHGDFDVCVGRQLSAEGLLPNKAVSGQDDAGQDVSWLSHDGNSGDFDLQPSSQDQPPMITVTAPICIDLGGIAKGFAIDQALALVPEDMQVAINAGGDMGFHHWPDDPIYLRHPGDPSVVLPIPRLTDHCATSADYYQDKPCYLGADGQLCSLERSITVFADSAMLADALTKVVAFSAHSEAILMAYQATAVCISLAGAVSITPLDIGYEETVSDAPHQSAAIR